MISGERSPISALIFDMDGLLVDSEPYAEVAMRSFLGRYGHVLTADVSIRLLGRRVPEAIQIVAEHFDLVEDRAELVTLYNEIRTAAIRGNLRPLPGAAEIIAFGREHRLRLALATSNTREHVEFSLAETALTDLFDAEATGEEVEHGKPEPDIFLLAAQRLAVAPDACVVLEDSAAGVAAANAAGMRSIWIPQPRSEGLAKAPNPDVTVADLVQAIAWLQSQGVGAASTVA